MTRAQDAEQRIRTLMREKDAVDQRVQVPQHEKDRIDAVAREQELKESQQRATKLHEVRARVCVHT